MNLVTKDWNWSIYGSKRVFWSDETNIYCLGSDSNKWVWKKPQKELQDRLIHVPSSLKEDYWWCESVSQIFWAYNECTLERWVCSWYLIPIYPLRLLYQPLQIQQVSGIAEVMGGNHFGMTTRGLGKLWEMLGVNLYDSTHWKDELRMG
jgi:hypothetical protein